MEVETKRSLYIVLVVILMLYITIIASIKAEASDNTKKTKAVQELVKMEYINLDEYALIYNGLEQWPYVVYNGTILTKDVDYEINVIGDKQPIDAGVYNVSIWMKGKYTCDAPIEKSFYIEKQDLNVEELIIPQIEVSSDYIELKNTIDTYEYQVSGVDLNDSENTMINDEEWQSVNLSGDTILVEDLIPGKPYYIYFRIKETDNFKASNIFRFAVSTSLVVEIKGDTENAIKSRQTGHVLSVSVIGEKVTGDSPESYKYVWYRDGEVIEGANEQTYKLGVDDINHMIRVVVHRGTPYESLGISQEILSIPEEITEEQAKKIVKVDYLNEKIEVEDSNRFELSFNENSLSGVSELNDLSLVIDESEFDIYVRNIVDKREQEYTCPWIKVSLKGRPAKPNLTIKNASGKNVKDGTITSETKGLEYRLKTDKIYTELKDGVKLVPGNYLVRVAASDENFAGINIEVTIGYGNSNVAKASKKPTGRGKIIYNGQGQELVSKGTSEEGAVLYSTNRNGSYSSSVPTAKAPGTYEIWWKIKADQSHVDSEPSMLTTTITKKQVSISGKITAEKYYDGNASISIDWKKIKLNGIVNNEDVSVTGNAAFEDAEISSNKKLKITGLKLVGADKDNYVLAYTSITGTGVIKAEGVEATREMNNEKESPTRNSAASSYRPSNTSVVNRNEGDSHIVDRSFEDMAPQDDYAMYIESIWESPNLTAGRIIVDGDNTEARLLSKYMDEEDIPQDEVEIIDKTIKECELLMRNIRVVKYMDISVFSESKDDGWKSVHETLQPVEMVLWLDKEDVDKESKFYVLRVHDEEIEMLSDEDDDDETVTIASSLFSTYVLIADGPDVPLAGSKIEENNIWRDLKRFIPYSLIFFMVAGIVIIRKKYINVEKNINNK